MSVSFFFYEGYELTITLDEPGYKGECEKLKYYTRDSDMGSLITQFKSFIDSKKEKQLSEKQLTKESIMQPKYQVAISRTVGTVTYIYFDRPISTTLSETITNLGSYQGVTVHLQLTGDGYYIITTPIWDSKSIPDELLSILLKNGFDRDSILIN